MRTPDLHDAQFVVRALKDGLRPERCPLCHTGVLAVRDPAAFYRRNCLQCQAYLIRGDYQHQGGR